MRPLVAFTITLYPPPRKPCGTWIVRIVVAVPFATRCTRWLLRVTFRIETVDRVAFPLNPSTLLRVTVAVADSPGLNENENGKTEREKSGPKTLTCIEVDRVRFPPV